MKDYPAIQFALLRIIAGIYFVQHFAFLIPYAGDIWSNKEAPADASLNFAYSKIPNLLTILDSPAQVAIFVAILLALSIALLLGIARPFVCLLIWYGWACLLQRNSLISNPGLPMMGWLLLAMALAPKGEPLSAFSKKSSTQWQMPRILFIGAWLIMGLTYTVSGIDKAMSPSWQDGSAMTHLMTSPLARDWWWTRFLAASPEWLLQIATWSTPALEIGFGALCLFQGTRIFAWFALIAMHLGILTVIDFADLTFGALMLHFLVYDPKWFKVDPDANTSRVVFFDGVCGFCNVTVNTLIDNDPNGVLKFSPLQGDFAKKTLSKDFTENLDTIAYYRHGKTYTRTGALIRIVRDLGGIGALAYPLLIIPSFLRDPFYNLFASFRYKFFGKLDACRIPSSEEQARFID